MLSTLSSKSLILQLQNMKTTKLALSLVTLVCTSCVFIPVHAFQSTAFSVNTQSQNKRLSSTLLHGTDQVEETLSSQYPLFMKLVMSKNTDMWKKLSDASSLGFTIFAPSDEAMRNLGEKKLSQLDDVRNGETAEKIAAFHAIEEKVTADELYNSGGVVTLGGVIDVGRSKTGGFMGIGAKEDGGVTINGAKIVQSFMVENSYIHEVDALVSPEILWRYIDQLRIPGSK